MEEEILDELTLLEEIDDILLNLDDDLDVNVDSGDDKDGQ